MVKAVKIRVYGDVQGVGFRGRVKSMAMVYGVFGYVRNLPDGSVEIHVEGSEDRVDAFVEAAKNLKEFDVWEIELLETGVIGYNDFVIVP
ncbi:MAG: acylphosphatase [Ignisphaera sp.]